MPAENEWERISQMRERTALREVVALRATLDQVEPLLVARARGVGVTWGEIGLDLGITRQSAHRRYGHVPPLRDQSPFVSLRR